MCVYMCVLLLCVRVSVCVYMCVVCVCLVCLHIYVNTFTNTIDDFNTYAILLRHTKTHARDCSKTKLQFYCKSNSCALRISTAYRVCVDFWLLDITSIDVLPSKNQALCE